MVLCRRVDPPLPARATPRGPSARPDRGYNPLFKGRAMPATGTVVVADESNRRLSVVRDQRRATRGFRARARRINA